MFFGSPLLLRFLFSIHNNDRFLSIPIHNYAGDCTLPSNSKTSKLTIYYWTGRYLLIYLQLTHMIRNQFWTEYRKFCEIQFFQSSGLVFHSPLLIRTNNNFSVTSTITSIYITLKLQYREKQFPRLFQWKYQLFHVNLWLRTGVSTFETSDSIFPIFL